MRITLFYRKPWLYFMLTKSLRRDHKQFTERYEYRGCTVLLAVYSRASCSPFVICNKCFSSKVLSFSYFLVSSEVSFTNQYALSYHCHLHQTKFYYMIEVITFLQCIGRCTFGAFFLNAVLQKSLKDFQYKNVGEIDPW